MLLILNNLFDIVYLKPVNYCHFIIQYFPRFAGQLLF